MTRKTDGEKVGHEPQCNACGNCCRVILLSDPPRRLEDAYREWKRWHDRAPDFNGSPADIALLYPALTGTCKGKWKNTVTGEYRYAYGPCNFLKDNRCAVHHIKPYMCVGYPYYRYGRYVEIGATAGGPNPSYIRGCGFNASQTDGWTLEDFAKLEPLTEDEQEFHTLQVDGEVKADIAKLDKEGCGMLKQPRLKKRKGKA